MRKRLGGVLGLALLASMVAFAPVDNAGATNIATPVKLRKVVAGLDNPVALAWRGNNGGTIFVAQQTGSIVTVRDTNIVGKVLTLPVSYGGERGLLGIAFSNDGSKLYVDYTDKNGNIEIVEYGMNADNSANPKTRRLLLTIPHSTYPNHNGGNLVMGPSGMLYIGVGDGGGGGDPLHNGQNKDSLLAKILRIDPRKTGSKPYGIPKGNPFVGDPNARPEVWMWGLRNPWRFSFDKQTHDTWIGDVGQDSYEEIDFAKAGESGINWGWPLREGKHQYDGAAPPGARDPIVERPHTAGDCAIIGGYVYRGKAIKGFQGTYIFGDECTGEIRAIQEINGKVAHARDLRLNVQQLSTFGEGPGGEIYAASLHGELYRLEAK